ncbi:hypothetical protein M422DRAFT_274996 [Sphaerobolus stellatus SS14]|uniref:Uncharacterized protein n=1 Tax=Sphaerobolus stellatus (strain SS14) TaxID=990650 RepID=A0A0C9U578_SPHS4|nr:hypothetical protein M422DRAFT_274996 [Sphaerobolus stellatus SS14]
MSSLNTAPENSSPGTALIQGITVLQHTEILHTSIGCTLFAIAEFPIGFDEKKSLNTVMAATYYKVPADETHPADGSTCYISGKIASLMLSVSRPNNVEQDMIDFILDTFFIHQLSGKQMPHAPLVTITGTSGQTDGRHQFLLDISQYFQDHHQPSGYIFSFAEGGRFCNKVPMPFSASICTVAGILTGQAIHNNENLTRLPINIWDISFLATNRSSVATSPIKGRKGTSSNWLIEQDKPQSSQRQRSATSSGENTTPPVTPQK